MSELPPDTVEAVIDLICRSTGAPRRKVVLDAALGDDLGIDGDDAAELLSAFSKEFRVDLSAFDHDRYFGPEAGFSIVTWLYGKITGTLPVYKPLTVRALVIATIEGNLMSPSTS
jgi:acyl carrier protein